MGGRARWVNPALLRSEVRHKHGPPAAEPPLLLAVRSTVADQQNHTTDNLIISITGLFVVGGMSSSSPIGATSGSSSNSNSNSVVLETFLLSLFRLAFFICCRQYVNASLFSDLKLVIKQDGNSDSLESPDPDSIHLDNLESGFNSGRSNGKGLAAQPSSSSGVNSSLLSPLDGNSTPRRQASPAPSGTSRLYTRLSTGLFCLAFSESCTLFTLLLFGDVISDR